ncbi:MAG: hypothetical protein Q9174_007497, partial [Haloplaca sp. 1 TL-2023]
VAVPITNNKGLDYENFSFASTGPVQIGGLASSSGTNRVGAAGPVGIPAVKPDIRRYKFFSPKSFFFGCVVRTGVPLASVATACTVTVNGFVEDRKVATQEFTFQPPLSPVTPVQMRKAVLNQNNFGRVLTRVEFSYPTQLVAIYLMDDFEYKIYN